MLAYYEYEKRNLERGLCRKCPRPLAPNSVQYCDYHQKKAVAYVKTTAAKYHREGRCSNCGIPLNKDIDGNDKWLCNICRTRAHLSEGRVVQ